MWHSPSSLKRSGAFTLTELLVALMLIATLALLLMRGSGGLQEKARASKCMGNLRQIGALLSLYATDHRGEMPPATRDGATILWYRQLYPYLNITSTAAGQSIFACPSKKSSEGTGHSYGMEYNASLGSGATPPSIRFAQLMGDSPLTAPSMGRRWLLLDAKWYFIRVGNGSSHPPTAVQLRHHARANVLLPDLSVEALSRKEINEELYLYRTYPIPLP